MGSHHNYLDATTCDIVGPELGPWLCKEIFDNAMRMRKAAAEDKVEELLFPFTEMMPASGAAQLAARLEQPRVINDGVGPIALMDKAGQLLSYAEACYEHARDQFLENVAALAVERYLLHGSESLLTAEQVGKMTTNFLASHVGETDATRKARAREVEKGDHLTEALDLFRRHERPVPWISRSAPAGADQVSAVTRAITDADTASNMSNMVTDSVFGFLRSDNTSPTKKVGGEPQDQGGNATGGESPTKNSNSFFGVEPFKPLNEAPGAPAGSFQFKMPAPQTTPSSKVVFGVPSQPGSGSSTISPFGTLARNDQDSAGQNKFGMGVGSAFRSFLEVSASSNAQASAEHGIFGRPAAQEAALSAAKPTTSGSGPGLFAANVNTGSVVPSSLIMKAKAGSGRSKSKSPTRSSKASTFQVPSDKDETKSERAGALQRMRI